MRGVRWLGIVLVVAIVWHTTARAQQPFVFVRAATTAAVAPRTDSATRLSASAPLSDCANLRIVLTGAGVLVGFTAGFAVDLAGALGGSISRDAMYPVLILATLAGGGLGYALASHSPPCS